MVSLLGTLVAPADSIPLLDHADEVSQWAASGAMALTGRREGPPLAAPVGFVSRVRWIESLLWPWLDVAGAPSLDVLALLGERAAIAGFERNGTTSCGGTTRLLQASDGWVALSLTRPEDVAAVPALFDGDVTDDPWQSVTAAVATRRAHELLARAALLGVPMSGLGESAARQAPNVTELGSMSPAATLSGVLVVDLSSLWAGPLCAHVLGLAGATVVKVESVLRPDGARNGPTAFFDLLHNGHDCVAVDLTTSLGVTQLVSLLDRADVVIEASRPRALAQLGISPERVASTGRLRAWVSITGHGRTGDAAMRVAFGDDAAVSGGLVAYEGNEPRFLADAIADPLTGVVATVGVLRALMSGRRVLLNVSMAGVAAAFSGIASAAATPFVENPRARVARSSARSLGADNNRWLTEARRST